MPRPSQLDRFLNSKGRSGRHVATGLAVTAGVGLLTSALVALTADPRETAPEHDGRPIVQKPRSGYSILLPALMSAATLAGLRVWNAPSGPERSSALRLWSVSQAVSGFWMASRPRSMAGQMMAAMMSAGMAAAFAHQARKIDPRAGFMASPMGSAVRWGNMIGDKLHRRDRPEHATVH